MATILPDLKKLVIRIEVVRNDILLKYHSSMMGKWIISMTLNN